MEEIYSYYKENIDAYTRRLGNLKKKIHLMGSIRLALVVGAILSLWIFRDESWQWLTGITFAYIIPFALLMWYHNKMYARKDWTMISARSTGRPIRSRASTLSAWIWMCLETAPCFNRSIVP